MFRYKLAALVVLMLGGWMSAPGTAAELPGSGTDPCPDAHCKDMVLFAQCIDEENCVYHQTGLGRCTIDYTDHCNDCVWTTICAIDMETPPDPVPECPQGKEPLMCVASKPVAG
jgi:hypothetical protein